MAKDRLYHLIKLIRLVIIIKYLRYALLIVSQKVKIQFEK